MDFVTSHFEKMKLWPVEHFFQHKYLSSKLDSPLIKTLERENLILMINMLKKVFNWSEVHLFEMTCYKIHTIGSCSCQKKPHKRTSIEKNWWKELPEASNCRNSHRYYRQYQPRHRLQKSHWIRLEWKWWVCLPWEMRKLRIEARTKREGGNYFF